jgi:hypothetical protein
MEVYVQMDNRLKDKAHNQVHSYCLHILGISAKRKQHLTFPGSRPAQY